MNRFRFVLAAAVLASGVAVAVVELHGSPAQAAPAASPTSFASTPGLGTHARCPVSGDEFVVDRDTKMEVYNGRTYAFCCPDCAPSFRKNPAKYAK